MPPRSWSGAGSGSINFYSDRSGAYTGDVEVLREAANQVAMAA